MRTSGTFRIGVLADRSGVNIETIRYYERVGLLPKPARSGGGSRLYRTTDADRLAFIRRARGLGFSLDEIQRLLDLVDRKTRSCPDVYEIASSHIADVRAKLADLHRMERALSDIMQACAQGTMPDCPLLSTLARPA